MLTDYGDRANFPAVLTGFTRQGETRDGIWSLSTPPRGSGRPSAENRPPVMDLDVDGNGLGRRAEIEHSGSRNGRRDRRRRTRPAQPAEAP